MDPSFPARIVDFVWTPSDINDVFVSERAFKKQLTWTSRGLIKRSLSLTVWKDTGQKVPVHVLYLGAIKRHLKEDIKTPMKERVTWVPPTFSSSLPSMLLPWKHTHWALVGILYNTHFKITQNSQESHLTNIISPAAGHPLWIKVLPCRVIFP